MSCLSVELVKAVVLLAWYPEFLHWDLVLGEAGV